MRVQVQEHLRVQGRVSALRGAQGALGPVDDTELQVVALEGGPPAATPTPGAIRSGRQTASKYGHTPDNSECSSTPAPAGHPVGFAVRRTHLTLRGAAHDPA